MFQRVMSGGGGSVENEDILWENPNPTRKDVAFAPQDITLNNGISNYKRLRLVILTQANTYRSFEFSVSEFIEATDTNGGRMGVAERLPNWGARYMRTFQYRNDTQIIIDSAYAMNSAGQTNSYVLPNKVIGIN